MPAIIVPYIRGLLQGHKITATFLNREFGVSHDCLTRMLQKQFAWKRIFLRLIHQFFGSLRGGYLVIDDTVIAKPYGKKFANAVFAYSSCLEKVIFGYHVVVLAWTNGIITIPLSFRFYQDKRKTKIALAQELLTEARYFWHLHPLGVLFDSWYAAGSLLEQIQKYHWHFYCQFKKNRTITGVPIMEDMTCDGERLIGFLTNGMKVLILRHEGKYFASNQLLQTDDHLLGTYKIRWSIETIFRFCKDQLHLEECQARSQQAQEKHLLSCFLAYCFLQREQQIKQNQTLYSIKTDWILHKRLGYNRIIHYAVNVLNA